MPRKSPTVARWLVALVTAAVLPTLFAAVATLLYAYKEENEGFQKGLKDTTRALALVVDREIAHVPQLRDLRTTWSSRWSRTS